MAAGPQVVARLSLALGSRDPEVARRSQYVLARIVRADDAGFLAMENVARSGQQPSAKIAEAIIHREQTRRDLIRAGMAEQRQRDAQRLLREARTALHQGRFAESREKALAAQDLKVTYHLFDDRPELVLAAIQQAESREANLVRK